MGSCRKRCERIPRVGTQTPTTAPPPPPAGSILPCLPALGQVQARGPPVPNPSVPFGPFCSPSILTPLLLNLQGLYKTQSWLLESREVVIFLPLIDVFPVGSKGLGFADLGFLCWAVLGTPVFLQVADYSALGPAPVYVVSPNFARFIQLHPVRICVHTQFFTFPSAPSCTDICVHTHTVSFGSLISSLEYLISSSNIIGSCCKCAW